MRFQFQVVIHWILAQINSRCKRCSAMFLLKSDCQFLMSSLKLPIESWCNFFSNRFEFACNFR
ncbi:hypothetical protein ERO13_D02G154750v2 [Gossypium hirsutum]|uniref:Uncharacterized protein n=3 Tax=Gossypium TaxID=3633 RepID=A0A5J5SER1_GOSBA|nr:hypothetical protein ES319_D02G178800v1 [Gossypium barbadense]KAB2041887.1 hypothetical protein ES319_D02G178800v1 [Gossypium barbadense]KAG4159083.1 hypothetical protein ERO13_D02G154750v2 [Gossypium hirsutum]TYG80136.1 hypothetical protein ES288_D02G192600v1 [Gossypium darwinii]TYI94157.1 hypothetical protein E1A91_D02G182800v1 [Gossypium mustelinum]